MIRYLVSVIFAVIMAALGGILTSEYIFKNFNGFEQLKIGQWYAAPYAGTKEADPYAVAHRFQQNDLVLGRAEGLVFHAWHDDEGNFLNSNCHYKIVGPLPTMRFFTLYAIDEDQLPINAPFPFPAELNSDSFIFDINGNINITISAKAQPKNWLYIKENQKFGLVMTLYDTPIASETGLVNPLMPKIERIKDKACD